jgi:hypothetical protein
VKRSFQLQHDSLKICFQTHIHTYYVPINQTIHANMHMILSSKEKDLGVDICSKNKGHWEPIPLPVLKALPPQRSGIGSIYLSSVVINHLKTNFKSNMLNFKVLIGSLCPLRQGYNYCSINHEQFPPKLHIITMKFKVEWHEHEFNS